MKVPRPLQRLQLGDNGFAFDPASGLTYTLSASSVRLVAWLNEGCPEDELPARLMTEYDTTSHVARRDVDHFLSVLRAYQLL